MDIVVKFLLEDHFTLPESRYKAGQLPCVPCVGDTLRVSSDPDTKRVTGYFRVTDRTFSYHPTETLIEITAEWVSEAK